MSNLRVNPYQTNVSFSGKTTKIVSLPEKIASSFKKLHDRAEREVTEYDYFKQVQENFKNPDKSLYVGDISLKISQPPKELGANYKTHRHLEATVYSPTKGQNVSRPLASGTKKEILEKLKEKTLHTELEDFIKESSGMMILD